MSARPCEPLARALVALGLEEAAAVVRADRRDEHSSVSVHKALLSIPPSQRRAVLRVALPLWETNTAGGDARIAACVAALDATGCAPCGLAHLHGGTKVCPEHGLQHGPKAKAGRRRVEKRARPTGIDLYHLAGSSVTAELAVAPDGRRFIRYQENTARGYRWTAWESTTEVPRYQSNGLDPATWDDGSTGSGWILTRHDASVVLPRTDGPAQLSGWVGVAFYRVVGCDGTVEVRVRPNERGLERAEVHAELDLYGTETLATRGPFPARHTARLRAIGREALRQMLAELGPEVCAYLTALREATRAAGPEWKAPPDHLPCSLEDYSFQRIIVQAQGDA